MAKRKENHNFERRGRNVVNKEKYPKIWFDGDTWECVRGEDFNIGPTSFRTNIGEQAKVYGMKIRANVFVDEEKVVFQAYVPEPEDTEEDDSPSFES